LSAKSVGEIPLLEAELTSRQDGPDVVAKCRS
jgi:hypothetical protein